MPCHPQSQAQTFVVRQAYRLYLPVMKTIWLMMILTCSGLALAGENYDAPATTVKPKATTAQFQVRPIGQIDKKAGRTYLRLQEHHEKGLLGIEQWSHIWVFYWFDRNDTPEKRAILQVHPRGNRDNPLTGVFATRSPARPNLIALSLCRVISVEGSTIEIEEIDAFDQTPVIDIKPYIEGIDRPKGQVKSPDWISR